MSRRWIVATLSALSVLTPHVSSAQLDDAHDAAGMFEPKPDSSTEDDALPAGTIRVTLVDADEKPLAKHPLTLGIMETSVAKGDSRKRVARETGADGVTVFDQLETGSGFAYRVSAQRDGATFGAPPFQLSPKRGTNVTLHVYPVTRSIEQAMVVSQAVTHVEVKDDRIQVEQLFSVFNFGKVAWVPDNVIVRLPPEFTALNGSQTMGDQGIDPVEHQGARLRGTFGPGQSDVEFRWQLPYSGDRDVNLEIGMVPHVAVARVMSPASKDMRLEVEEFPASVSRTDNRGQRMLITEKQLRRDDRPLSAVRVSIQNLPSPGPGRWIATGLAGVAVLLGIGAARRPRQAAQETSSAKKRRKALLAEIEELEAAHARGEVGPKAYARARRELVDAIAATLAETPRS